MKNILRAEIVVEIEIFLTPTRPPRTFNHFKICKQKSVAVEYQHATLLSFITGAAGVGGGGREPRRSLAVSRRPLRRATALSPL